MLGYTELAQSLPLSLCSGVTPGCAQGTTAMPEFKPGCLRARQTPSPCRISPVLAQKVKLPDHREPVSADLFKQSGGNKRGKKRLLW